MFVGLVVLVAFLGLRRWERSSGPGRVAKLTGIGRRVARLLLVVPAVMVLAAMARGCEDSELRDTPGPGEGRVTCTSWRAEDCPPVPEVLVPADAEP
jgi:hypothetical protein